MEYCEFLLQRKGDRTWHPVKRRSIQIPEGKYRVLAHTSDPNTPVAIRVAYQATGENPPKRRFHRRKSHTNQNGLTVVIPYTHFKPGIWQLACSPDTTSDKAGDSLIQIQVLPKPPSPEAQTKTETETETPLALDTSGNAATTTSVEAKTAEIPENPLLEESKENLEQVLQQVFDQFLEAFDETEFFPSINPIPEESATAVLDPNPVAETALLEDPTVLFLTLNQQTSIAHAGAGFTVSGSLNFINPVAADNPKTFRGKLQIVLRHPEHSQVLLEEWQLLPEKQLPLEFDYILTLPEDCQGHLIVGEVKLHDLKEKLIASEPFTVTVDLDRLLTQVLIKTEEGIKAIAQPDVAAPPDSKTPPAKETKPLRLAFKDIANASANPAPLQPASEQPLPPQIYQPSSSSNQSKSLQLPKLPNPQAEEAPLEPEIPESPEEIDEELTEELKAPNEVPPEPPTEEENAFKSLKLADRFWARLNSLAVEPELLEDLEMLDEEEEVEVSPETSAELTTASTPEQETTQPDIAPSVVESETKVLEDTPFEAEELTQPRDRVKRESQEIVVEDEVLDFELPVSKLQPATVPLLLSDRAIPTPQLIIPDAELIAGEPLSVQVKLPSDATSLYVKLWIQDRQSRFLLEPPHTLKAFSLTESGELGAIAQLKVPVGGLEIRFEAIAIDASTQQESHKVGVDRIVVPPDAIEFSLDEFEL